MRGIDAERRAEGRRRAGAYLRRLREENGLTQLELSQIIGFSYFTMIGQVEPGTVRLPPKQMVAWADALGVGHATFGKRMLYHYEPQFWAMIYGPPDDSAPKDASEGGQDEPE